MTNNEMCRGCLIYESQYRKVSNTRDNMYVINMEPCSKFSVEDKKECPCINCVVKTMCKVTCEDYNKKFINNYDNMNKF